MSASPAIRTRRFGDTSGIYHEPTGPKTSSHPDDDATTLVDTLVASDEDRSERETRRSSDASYATLPPWEWNLQRDDSILTTSEDFATSAPSSLTQASRNSEQRVYTLSVSDGKPYIRDAPPDSASVGWDELAVLAPLHVARRHGKGSGEVRIPGVKIDPPETSASDLLSTTSSSASTGSSICGDRITINKADPEHSVTFTRESTRVARFLIEQAAIERELEQIIDGRPVACIVYSDAFDKMKKHQYSFPLTRQERDDVQELRAKFGNKTSGTGRRGDQCEVRRLLADWCEEGDKHPQNRDDCLTDLIATTSLVVLLMDSGQKLPRWTPTAIQRENIMELLKGYTEMKRLWMSGFPDKLDPRSETTFPSGSMV